MKSSFEELYDYEAVRSLGVATALVVRLAEPTLVVGSSQPDSVLAIDRADFPVRRRRGGGGVVLLQPDDVWIDFWIPSDDARFRSDVTTAAVLVGSWWGQALATLRSGNWSLGVGGMRGQPEHGVACFAMGGPGEVFLDGRKAVGLTQWRVREGSFISTVLHRGDSSAILTQIPVVPEGLESALQHHNLETLGFVSHADDIERAVLGASNPWLRRQLFLSAN
ncbi:MAG: hypothetical protein WCG86_01605 [Actinomycetota bacterium]